MFSSNSLHSMIVDDLNLVSITVMPTKHNPPLIIDPNGVKPLPLPLQRFQSISRRLAKIADFRRIVQIEQLTTGRTDQIGWKFQNGF